MLTWTDTPIDACIITWDIRVEVLAGTRAWCSTFLVYLVVTAFGICGTNHHQAKIALLVCSNSAQTTVDGPVANYSI